jgi:hypothetical protein
MKYFLFIFLLLLLQSCTKDKTQTPDSPKQFVCDSLVTYTNMAKVIMDTKCALLGCHNATTSAGGFNLLTYAACKDLASTPILLCTITHGNCGYKAMPYPIGSPKLSDSLITIISCWINNGAPL